MVSIGTGRVIGTAVLVIGWSVVAAGAVLIGLGVAGRAAERDEVVGSGLALLMVGMLVVLLGNYVHHSESDDDESDKVAGGDER